MAQTNINSEIASKAVLRPIEQVAQEKLGLERDVLDLYGKYKAKLPFCLPGGLNERPDGKLILMTAMSPTAAGEGKTTTSVGLTDGLAKIGKKVMVALREPSLGPCFGMKGGACGGGYAQVVPMTDINLHFTGDFHAITSAHNLLAAMVDNHLYWGHAPFLDARQISWRRIMDMNDRSLRQIVTGLGSAVNGFAREGSFDITAASEVMAVLCLATDMHDLQRRLGNIKVGQTPQKEFVFAKDVKAQGAMTALLKDAFNPNLVQTLEWNPAFVHGGPFGNIAHGCNSVVATKAALKLADYVVTEAGFGADLGAEKFFNIKCRRAGLKPDCAVVVATVKALKLHGGANPKELATEDLDALQRGLPNLVRHLDNVKKFEVPVVVAINEFTSDTKAELDLVREICAGRGVKMALGNHWAKGGEGAVTLAELVVKTIEDEPTNFRPLYSDDMSLAEKIQIVSKEIYGAEKADIPSPVLKQLEELENKGYGRFPICMAKTQYSFSTDPDKKGAPTGFTVPIREVRLSLGAEFLVVLTGGIMTMPGLPRVPAAEAVGLDAKGDVVGLF